MTAEQSKFNQAWLAMSERKDVLVHDTRRELRGHVVSMSEADPAERLKASVFVCWDNGFATEYKPERFEEFRIRIVERRK